MSGKKGRELERMLYESSKPHGNGNGHGKRISSLEDLVKPTPRKELRWKTEGQRLYMKTIDESVITLCAGVAGTGKTYIAIGKAVAWLLNGDVNRIVVSRPAIECGRGLGFLKGELQDKFAPYMRPIVDVFNDFLEPKQLQDYIHNDIIEFCPLEYMRGRSLHKTAIILDEAQNADDEQILMFMTRIGNDSRMIISGDFTQGDLPTIKDGAFKYAIQRAEACPEDGINVCYLTKDDIVRNKIIASIIRMLARN